MVFTKSPSGSGWTLVDSDSQISPVTSKVTTTGVPIGFLCMVLSPPEQLFKKGRRFTVQEWLEAQSTEPTPRNNLVLSHRLQRYRVSGYSTRSVTESATAQHAVGRTYCPPVSPLCDACVWRGFRTCSYLMDLAYCCMHNFHFHPALCGI